jgi:hypothetical protein
VYGDFFYLMPVKGMSPIFILADQYNFDNFHHLPCLLTLSMASDFYCKNYIDNAMYLFLKTRDKDPLKCNWNKKVWIHLAHLSFYLCEIVLVGIKSHLSIYVCFHKTVPDKCKLKINESGLIVLYLGI